ncbi:MAG: DUF924 domain-containing protein [Mojavia pulchra JT2-VF2]|jgi:hypothetical protein|uniref:DUF924 domain-containing protein n=1 Tax=Mojavia pulchra JT2-VF2 TaxID=287848 RepID=A0A951Q2P5_9NOST|nr:DUF924 domain-containing protein [Mojavia pulchra JT2-VF2]
MSQAKATLRFWFAEPDEPGYSKPKPFWFSKQPDFDWELEISVSVEGEYFENCVVLNALHIFAV